VVALKIPELAPAATVIEASSHLPAKEASKPWLQTAESLPTPAKSTRQSPCEALGDDVGGWEIEMTAVFVEPFKEADTTIHPGKNV
jgi:hypothetical protein